MPEAYAERADRALPLAPADSCRPSALRPSEWSEALPVRRRVVRWHPPERAVLGRCGAGETVALLPAPLPCDPVGQRARQVPRRKARDAT